MSARETIARGILLADDGGNPEPILAATEHSGDCTNDAWTCAACQAETYREMADGALRALDEALKVQREAEAKPKSWAKL